MRSALRAFHPETELRNVINDVQDLINRGPKLDRNLLMALNANVQKLIDDVARTGDLVKSMLAGQDLQNKQIADLKAQLAGIQPGQDVDAENLAAINATVATIEQTNAALAVAVPNSTVLAPATVPLGNPTAVLTAGTQPVTSDSAGNPIAPDAPGQPGIPVASTEPKTVIPTDFSHVAAPPEVVQIEPLPGSAPIPVTEVSSPSPTPVPTPSSTLIIPSSNPSV